MRVSLSICNSLTIFSSKSHCQLVNLKHRISLPCLLSKRIFQTTISKSILPSLLLRRMNFFIECVWNIKHFIIASQMSEPKCRRHILLPGSVRCPEAWENVLQFPFIMFRNKEKRKKLLLNSRFGLKILCPLKRKETCLYKPSLPSLTTPHPTSRFSRLRSQWGAKEREDPWTQEEGKTVARKAPEESWRA